LISLAIPNDSDSQRITGLRNIMNQLIHRKPNKRPKSVKLLEMLSKIDKIDDKKVLDEYKDYENGLNNSHKFLNQFVSIRINKLK